jgi:two-component system sensor histidine kinase UhpB
MKKTYRILHLEDSHADADLIRRQLQKSGLVAEYCIAADKESYSKCLMVFAPDVILCDHSLPQFDSVKAFDIYKEMKLEIPFILVTGSVSEEYAVEMMKNGIDDYLLKTNLHRLPQAIEQAIAKKENERKIKLAAIRLAQSEKYFRVLIEKSEDMITIASPNGKIVYSSPAIENILNYTPDEFKKISLYDIVHPDDLYDLKKDIRNILSVTGRSFYRQQRILHKNGGWVWCEGTVTNMLHEPVINGLVSNFRNITEGKTAEAELKDLNKQLRSLTSHLQKVREEERTRIAREIHDELGQQLTRLKMDIAWLNHKAENAIEEFIPKTNGMMEMVDESIRTIRKIVIELRPGILDDLGLVAALDWQAKEFQQRMGIRCTFEKNIVSEDFSSELKTCVFRIFQESLTNVARHAGATEVKARLHVTGGMLVLTIADNGKGIEEYRKSYNRSFGLLGMKERACILKGSFSIERLPEGGTGITLKIPITS